MKITVSKLENVKEIKTVSASSFYGIGLLTGIVTYFIEIFGIENKMLVKKIEKAKESALQVVIDQAKAIPGATGIMNLSFQMSGRAVLAYGTVFQAGEDTETGYSVIDEIPEI